MFFRTTPKIYIHTEALKLLRFAPVLLSSETLVAYRIYDMIKILQNAYIGFRRHASHSSHSWLDRQRKDIYVKKSRYDNYRARSAYKLIQIDDKYKFLRPGKVVIEVGAAPGSWTQVICQRLKLTEKDNKIAQSGMCLAIDIAAIQPVEGAICLGNADFTSPFTQGKILSWLDGRQVDCVISDMAPNNSGQKYLDHERIMKLVNRLIPFALQVIKPNAGLLLTKIWQGNQEEELVERLSKHFEHVRRVKPDASREDSAEIYILARDFIAPKCREQVQNESESISGK